MSSDDDLAIALSVIFGVFFLAAALIVAYFVLKYYNRRSSYDVTGEYHNNPAFRDDDDDTEGTFSFADPAFGQSEEDSQATFVIPYGVALLRSCKSFTHRLLATAIDGTSEERQSLLVAGSLEEVIAAAKLVSPVVDDLTKAMYPPLEDQCIVQKATDLVSAVEHLMLVTRTNCNPAKLGWLDAAALEVFRDYKALCKGVDRYQKMQEEAERDRRR